MKKTIILYGLSMAAIVFLLKFMEYRLLIRDLSIEAYIGIIATICTVLGIWMGLRLTRPGTIIQSATLEEFIFDEKKLLEIGMSQREYDVLKLMALGLSNQEIADQLFVSLNTVKTHVGNLFLKLDAKRRTQAVQQAKELGILP